MTELDRRIANAPGHYATRQYNTRLPNNITPIAPLAQYRADDRRVHGWAWLVGLAVLALVVLFVVAPRRDPRPCPLTRQSCAARVPLDARTPATP